MKSNVQPFNVMSCPLDGINLVEASAGTGKTWNICGLYLRLLLERGLSVREILVVTFTKAATAELRERMRTRLVEMLVGIDDGVPDSGDPFVAELLATLDAHGVPVDQTRARLALALATFDEASIFTIHAFCQHALADTPFSAALPFALELMPDDSELRMEAVHDFWRRHIAGDECTPLLATYLLQREDSPASYAKLLQRRLDKPLARVIWPDAIDLPARLDPAPLARAYAAAAATWRAHRIAIVRLLHESPALNRSKYRKDSIDASAMQWDDWFEAGDPLAKLVPKHKLDLCRASRLTSGIKKDHVAPAHAFCDEAETLLVERTALEEQLSLARLQLLRRLFDEVPPALRERKRERRVVSYQDLLFNLHAALHDGHNAELAASLRSRFRAALIDEFQDTDPLQFAIFDRIYGDGTLPLFIVGDPKQAIYSFRNADLHTYLHARNGATAQYTLAENQRSTPGLIAAVNALFQRNPRALMLDDLTFSPARVGVKPRAEWHDRSAPLPEFCVWMLPAQSTGGLLTRGDVKIAAARATAAEAARLLREARAGRITLSGRALQPGDIAVLVRRHAEGTLVRQELAALGIGSVELSQQSVFRTPDANDIGRVLRAVLEPAHSGLLRAALATELLGLDAAAIDAIAADEATLMAHIDRFAAYRETWLRSGVGVMLRGLFTREQVSTRMLARADGERRLTNLLHLAERLHHAAETHAAPDALLRWLQAQADDETVDEVAQLRLESDQNLVQIVTVHAAKGLEYPVVFCPYLWDGHSLQRNSAEGREYRDDAGATVIDFRSDGELGDEADAIDAQVMLENHAESLRLMYVALTRASHRCTIIGGCYGLPTARGGLSTTQSTRSLLNWLVAGNGYTPEAWCENKLDPAVIDAAWGALAAASAPHLQSMPLPLDPGTPLDAAKVNPYSLSALRPPARIGDGWRISSFTGLQQGMASETVASDHDARTRDAAIAAPQRALLPPGVDSDDILRFPRGANAGDCMHAIFEHIDFTDPSTWDSAIDRALRDAPLILPALPRHEQHRLLARMLARMLRDVMHTPLAEGIRLDRLTMSRRLTELEFSMPASGVAAASLNEALHALDYPMAPLAFRHLEGYLKGFIDLVFEHDGRYYLLDWKSNHLGYTAADYAQPALDDAMVTHGYHLQYLLYSVALTRYLAQRIPDYTHATHFGGVFYLFVRGVRPDWVDSAGQPAGVWFHRPTAQTLAMLAGLLGRQHTAVAQ
jgi:exodeoxyribonuclease V beta subunit